MEQSQEWDTFFTINKPATDFEKKKKCIDEFCRRHLETTEKIVLVTVSKRNWLNPDSAGSFYVSPNVLPLREMQFVASVASFPFSLQQIADSFICRTCWFLESWNACCFDKLYNCAWAGA